MKKSKQFSDKYGKIVEVGEVPEKRGTPGVTLLEGAYKVPHKDDEKPVKETAPVVEAEEVVEDVEVVEEEEASDEDE